jgi:hypothetical protein
VGYLSADTFSADYFLTQVVSHHDLPAVQRFIEEYTRQQVGLPGIFGVFFYRSANPRTLAILSRFLPVPVDALTREFGTGASAEQVCARTIRSLRAVGVRHVYVSNLPVRHAKPTLERILELAGRTDE